MVHAYIPKCFVVYSPKEGVQEKMGLGRRGWRMEDRGWRMEDGGSRMEDRGGSALCCVSFGALWFVSLLISAQSIHSRKSWTNSCNSDSFRSEMTQCVSP